MEKKNEKMLEPPKRENYPNERAFAKACSDYLMKRNAELYKRLADK